MNENYLDISSTYRNRERYPLPSNFDILFSDCGNRSVIGKAHDPYSTAAASYPPVNLEEGDVYNSEFFITTTSLTNTYQIDGVVLNGQSLLNPEDVENFYNGQVLEFGTETRTIKSYTVGDVDTIYHSGTIVSATDEATFVIADGVDLADRSEIDDYYVGKTVTVGSETRTIVDYDGATGTVTVFPPFSADPTGTATISGPTYLVELESDFTTAPTATIPVITAPTDLARIRGAGPTQYGTTTTTASPTTTIPIAAGQNNIYSGNFIHLWRVEVTGAGPPYIVTTVEDQYLKISSYDATTGDITLSEPFTGAAATYEYAILSFSGDNHYPLNYTGSRTSNQQPACHEVSLVSLTLPNLTLVTGGKIAFKPYVYVELTNLSTHMPTHIWSNNPNSKRAIFKVSVNDDISEPSSNPFVTLLCQCMTQTVVFKSNDNFRFSVRLPDGTYFAVDEPEYFSPSLPNPNIQIDALFRVKKCSGTY